MAEEKRAGLQMQVQAHANISALACIALKSLSG
jgi:hypothetical protein